MRWFRFAVFTSLVAVLQASLLLDIIALPPYSSKPNLLLILLVFFATYCNTTDAIITSFAIGFVADISVGVMGSQTISFGLFGTALAYLHRVITIRKVSYQAIAIFITAFLTGTLTHFLALLRGQAIVSNIYSAILGSALYSAVVGPIFFLPAAWFMRIKTHRFSRR